MFPQKTVLSKTNVKRNRMGSTQWTYHKERSVSTNLFLLKKLISV